MPAVTAWACRSASSSDLQMHQSAAAPFSSSTLSRCTLSSSTIQQQHQLADAPSAAAPSAAPPVSRCSTSQKMQQHKSADALSAAQVSRCSSTSQRMQPLQHVSRLCDTKPSLGDAPSDMTVRESAWLEGQQQHDCEGIGMAGGAAAARLEGQQQHDCEGIGMTGGAAAARLEGHQQHDWKGQYLLNASSNLIFSRSPA